ncbi:hypothetical protein D9613_004217 [Agrocybe pediades]|uniref:Cytochrome b5 heme-binding domain-containing protein n=1 Tax=Agrocybe pediades TaxID=84607 RepID=A0A8H4QK68_9AGAR|nr:hypothetical protein D9613_004217 [Agrocybe pediades]
MTPYMTPDRRRRYAATRGLFYSHMGWIFFKPTYERMGLIERDDLENDPDIMKPPVCSTSKNEVPLAIFFGFVCPAMIGSMWKDSMGGFVWGGLVARIFTHWDGLQPYSDEDTSKGNLILALLTGGEGNHNFHSFPHDFRSGPSPFDWDPSKWIILGLQNLGLAQSLKRAREEDLVEAVDHMKQKAKFGIIEEPQSNNWHGETWNTLQFQASLISKPGRCIILIDGYAVDVTSYMGEHPGGASILRKYSVKPCTEVDALPKTDWAFNGGLNNHSRAARRRMKELRVAKLVD